MRISDWSSDVCSSDLCSPHLGHLTTSSSAKLSQPHGATRPRLRADVRQGHRLPSRPPGDRCLSILSDWQSVVSGKSVTVRLDLGCRRCIKKKITSATHTFHHTICNVIIHQYLY